MGDIITSIWSIWILLPVYIVPMMRPAALWWWHPSTSTYSHRVVASIYQTDYIFLPLRFLEIIALYVQHLEVKTGRSICQAQWGCWSLPLARRWPCPGTWTNQYIDITGIWFVKSLICKVFLLSMTMNKYLILKTNGGLQPQYCVVHSLQDFCVKAYMPLLSDSHVSK